MHRTEIVTNVPRRLICVNENRRWYSTIAKSSLALAAETSEARRSARGGRGARKGVVATCRRRGLGGGGREEGHCVVLVSSAASCGGAYALRVATTCGGWSTACGGWRSVGPTLHKRQRPSVGATLRWCGSLRAPVERWLGGCRAGRAAVYGHDDDAGGLDGRRDG